MTGRRALLAGCVASLAVLVGRATEPPAGSVVVEPVPRRASALEQLAHARVLEDRLSGTAGRERLRRRLGVVEALRAVHAEHPGGGVVAARAALDAAAHLAALEFLDEALDELTVAVRLAGDGELAFEARLARAHAARRAGCFERALEDYRWCAARANGEQRVAVLLRTGDVHERAGRSEAARECWLVALDGAPPCVEVVEVFDRLARAALARGDDGAAAGWLETCRVRLGDALRARTPTGSTLRRALLAMHARLELAHRAADRATSGVEDGADAFSRLGHGPW